MMSVLEHGELYSGMDMKFRWPPNALFSKIVKFNNNNNNNNNNNKRTGGGHLRMR